MSTGNLFHIKMSYVRWDVKGKTISSLEMKHFISDGIQSKII